MVSLGIFDATLVYIYDGDDDEDDDILFLSKQDPILRRDGIRPLCKTYLCWTQRLFSNLLSYP